MTVMEDAPMDGLSDAGSIPARSTKNRLTKGGFFMLNCLLFSQK